MGLNQHYKQCLITLLVLYPSTFCLYFAILGRMDVYYHVSYFIEIRTAGMYTVFLCAIAKCFLLSSGGQPRKIWYLKFSALFGMFEMIVMIVISSLFWMYEYLHQHSMKYIIGLPCFCLVNVASYGSLFYSTMNCIANLLSQTHINGPRVVQGIPEFLRLQK